MSHELKEGVQLSYIESGDGGWSVEAGKLGSAESITVVMEMGQIGMVPWAKVVHKDGTVALVNLANIQSVGLLEARGGE